MANVTPDLWSCCRTSLPRDWYQIILLGDRGTCVNNLPKVVTWQRLGRELNSQPVESQANALTITPLLLLLHWAQIHLCLPFLFVFFLPLFFFLFSSYVLFSLFFYLLPSRIWTRSVSRPEVVGGDIVFSVLFLVKDACLFFVVVCLV